MKAFKSRSHFDYNIRILHCHTITVCLLFAYLNVIHNGSDSSCRETCRIFLKINFVFFSLIYSYIVSGNFLSWCHQFIDQRILDGICRFHPIRLVYMVLLFSRWGLDSFLRARNSKASHRHVS